MPQPVPIRSVHHVARTTRRLEASRRFYRNVLGFREIQRPPFSFGGAWLYNYGVQIHLIEDDQAPDPAESISTRADHLALHVDDIEEAKRVLQAHGIPFREGPGRPPRGTGHLPAHAAVSGARGRCLAVAESDRLRCARRATDPGTPAQPAAATGVGPATRVPAGPLRLVRSSESLRWPVFSPCRR